MLLFVYVSGLPLRLGAASPSGREAHSGYAAKFINFFKRPLHPHTAR